MLTILSSERKGPNFNYRRLPLTCPFPVIFALRTWAIWGRRRSILIMFVCATIVSHPPHSSSILFIVCVGRLRSFGGNYCKGHLKQCRFAVLSFSFAIRKFSKVSISVDPRLPPEYSFCEIIVSSVGKLWVLPYVCILSYQLRTWGGSFYTAPGTHNGCTK